MSINISLTLAAPLSPGTKGVLYKEEGAAFLARAGQIAHCSSQIAMAHLVHLEWSMTVIGRVTTIPIPAGIYFCLLCIFWTQDDNICREREKNMRKAYIQNLSKLWNRHLSYREPQIKK